MSLETPSFTEELEAGLAEWLAGQVDGLEFSPAGAYPPGVVGIFLASMPPAPDRAVSITSYETSGYPGHIASDVVAVQVRARGTSDPRSAQRIADRIHDVIQGVTHITLPTGVYVTQITRETALPMGADQNGRHETASTYAVTVHRPTTHRPD